MKKAINKTKLNFFIDILMFIVMIPVAGIGFLMRYILLPGFKRNEIYGRDVDLFYWGFDRHQWGTIHLILSLILLFLLLFHILFHWKQIVHIFRRMVIIKPLRIGLGLLLVLFTIIFGILPLFIKPQVRQAVLHDQHNNSRVHKKSMEAVKVRNQHVAEPLELPLSEKNQENKDQHKHKEIEIYGYMTINEVAEKYNISAVELATSIGVPAGNYNERLGRLKKQYDFQMNELKDYIESKLELK